MMKTTFFVLSYVVFLEPGTGLGVSPLPLFSPGSPEFGLKPAVGAGRLQGSYINGKC